MMNSGGGASNNHHHHHKVGPVKLLALPEDRISLSETLCLVREASCFVVLNCHGNDSVVHVPSALSFIHSLLFFLFSCLNRILKFSRPRSKMWRRQRLDANMQSALGKSVSAAFIAVTRHDPAKE
jgi:hypothetical protein